MTSFFSAEGGPIWIKFRRLVKNDMSTAVIWPKWKPEVEFQYGGPLGEFNGMSSQSHLPHCRVLPPGEFNDMSSQSHVSRSYCHLVNDPTAICHIAECSHLAKSMSCDRATLQGIRIPSTILKIVFRHILFYFCFLIARQHTDARYSYSKSARLSVRNVPVSDENGSTYRHNFFTIR